MIDAFPSCNDFLKLFYHAVPYGWLEITLLHHKLYPKTVWLELPNALNSDQLEWLTEQNDAGWNIYFGVTVRNGKAIRGRGHVSDALFTRALWADLDSHDESALARLRAEKPSLIVDSGGGYHGYWLLNSVLTLHDARIPQSERGVFAAADGDLLKRTLKGLALRMQADVKVAEFARIMRLPGFKNTKPERNNALCHVIEDRLYTYDFMALAMEYAPLVKPEIRIERTITPAVVDHLPRFLQDYLTNGAPAGERNSSLNKAAYLYNSMGKTEAEALADLGGRARADGLDDHEIMTTIGSAYRATPAPMMDTRSRRIAARDRKLR